MNNSFVITFLCYFTGIINSFFFTTISYWWFFHTLTIFWNVWFPVHARSFKISGYTKYLHIAIILITLTLSTIPVGAALGTGGYVISVHPPSLNYCFPRNPDALFYAFIFPFCIVSPTGVTVNLLTVWKLLAISKQSHNSKQVHACMQSSTEVHFHQC